LVCGRICMCECMCMTGTVHTSICIVAPAGPTTPACIRDEIRRWISCMHGLCICNNASSGSLLWTLNLWFCYLIKPWPFVKCKQGAMWAGCVCLFCDFWVCRRCVYVSRSLIWNHGKSLVKVLYKLVVWNIVRFLYVSYLKVKIECIRKKQWFNGFFLC